MKHKRLIVVNGDIALVPLTKGQEAVIDASDVPLISHHNWHVSGSKKVLYGRMKSRKKSLWLHHVFCPPKQGYEVDHVDGDGLNNRRANLRYVTKGQNKRNTYRLNKGVYFSRKTQKHYAVVNLGQFETVDEARDAYWRAIEQLFPDFVPKKQKGPTVA